MPKKRSFQRQTPSLSYRKRFVVATEGDQTEPRYFAMFNGKNSTVQVVLLKGKKKTAPSQVLDRVKREERRKGDQAWLVIDRDTWEEAELNEVFQACGEHGCRMALSNPRFEYWLLLHFEDGNGVNSGNCMQRLRTHLPAFTKNHVETNKFRPLIDEAIVRAEQRDNPQCPDWPKVTGTTVYRLVKELRKAEKGE
jgi:hypothetical protein